MPAACWRGSSRPSRAMPRPERVWSIAQSCPVARFRARLAGCATARAGPSPCGKGVGVRAGARDQACPPISAHASMRIIDRRCSQREAFPAREPRSEPLSPWEKRGRGEGGTHAEACSPAFPRPFLTDRRQTAARNAKRGRRSPRADTTLQPISPWERGWGEGRHSRPGMSAAVPADAYRPSAITRSATEGIQSAPSTRISVRPREAFRPRHRRAALP